MCGSRMDKRLSDKDEFQRKHKAQEYAARQRPIGEPFATFVDEHPQCKKTDAPANRIASCIMGATLLAIPFIATCWNPHTMESVRTRAIARRSSGRRRDIAISDAVTKPSGAD